MALKVNAPVTTVLVPAAKVKPLAPEVGLEMFKTAMVVVAVLLLLTIMEVAMVIVPPNVVLLVPARAQLALNVIAPVPMLMVLPLLFVKPPAPKAMAEPPASEKDPEELNVSPPV